MPFLKENNHNEDNVSIRSKIQPLLYYHMVWARVRSNSTQNILAGSLSGEVMAEVDLDADGVFSNADDSFWVLETQKLSDDSPCRSGLAISRSCSPAFNTKTRSKSHLEVTPSRKKKRRPVLSESSSEESDDDPLSKDGLRKPSISSKKAQGENDIQDIKYLLMKLCKKVESNERTLKLLQDKQDYIRYMLL